MADCLFCQIAAGEVESYAVYESDTIYGFLDVRPVFKGHTLLVPRHHLDTLLDLPDELMPDLLGAARAVAGAVRDGLGAQGSFVAINNVVSQSVPHLHVHVVPRTKGDGLRGFFWPRTRYADASEAESYASKLRAALG
jgi:histidine triad (HIT) family protein